MSPTTEETSALITLLETRFKKNIARHKDLKWENVLAKLADNKEKIRVLQAMEETGGEPDVVGYDEDTNEFIFYDCAIESPKGRRSLCYDDEALQARKENKPANSALKMAAEIGITLLNETQYRQLQQLGKFDTKTSSWVATPAPIRTLSGALFCDRRYDTVFLYHNGAESYYAARGFRGLVKV